MAGGRLGVDAQGARVPSISYWLFFFINNFFDFIETMPLRMLYIIGCSWHIMQKG